MIDKELRSWLHLLHAPGLGFARIQQLLTVFGDASSIVSQRSFPEQINLPAAAKSYLLTADDSQIQAELSWLEKANNHLLHLNDPLYPPQLKDTADPPPVLFVKGSMNCLLLPQLAVVGSRNADNSGLQNTRFFCSQLVKQGMVITSGLATGIDSAAHRAALQAGGKTIAVMGTGINSIYPRNNRQLAKDIVQNGAVISEFPLNTPPKAHHFPRRNRIIAGLSLATLVVEAAEKSGTLITARLAMEQNRPVMAVPGSIHNPRVKGCHALIKQGAKLVESAEDIYEELTVGIEMLKQHLGERLDEQATMKGDMSPSEPIGKQSKSSPRNLTLDNYENTPKFGLSSEQQQLLKKMPFEPTDFDQLLTLSGRDSAELSSDLLLLELNGLIDKQPGNKYLKIKDFE